jgi:S1-C subfamily serine protease
MMVSYHDIELGIDAIQTERQAEGARLLRIALRDAGLPGPDRASVALWLAMIETTLRGQILLLEQAAALDPANSEIQAQLAQIQGQAAQASAATAGGPPPPPGTLPGMPTASPRAKLRPRADSSAAGTTAIDDIQVTVGIEGGPNGPGTGIFLTYDGVLATTRHITGGSPSVTVSLRDGRRMPGRVLRSYAIDDLAFIQVPAALYALQEESPYPTVAPGAPLTALAFAGASTTAAQRDTRQRMLPGWVATTFSALAGAGGEALFDGSNQLAGILTRNVSRASGTLFALHIGHIRARLAEAQAEASGPAGTATYCPACGGRSHAPAVGGAHCEHCGAALPGAAPGAARASSAALTQLYGEGSEPPCPLCGAATGYGQGRCLRCGHDVYAQLR